MRILVTGGAGYVGCRLAPHLLDAGHSVRVLDKLLFGAGGLSAVKDRIDLRVGDIRAVSADVLDDIDAVIHLAGLSNDPMSEYDPAANTSINIQGTLRLADLCRSAGIARFVFASSCSVYYAEWPTDKMLDESAPVSPRAPYSASKRKAEIGLLRMVGKGFAPVILRKGTVHGWSPRMRYDLVVNAFVKDAFTRRRLSVHAGGRAWRPMLAIGDAVEAYRLAAEADPRTVGGAILNVLTENRRVVEIAHCVRLALESHADIKIAVDVQETGGTRSYRTDGAKAGQLLGFEPKGTIAQAAVEIWDRLMAGEDCMCDDHYNIRWFEQARAWDRRIKEMGGTVL